MDKVATGAAVRTHQQSNSQERVDLVMESLCGQGCRAVWDVIATLESGQALPQTDGLDPEELELLLAELKSIMAVYAGTCSA